MTSDKRKFVKATIFGELCVIFEMSDASNISDHILDEVCEDIDVTADEYFNSSDIRMALQRTLLGKIIND